MEVTSEEVRRRAGKKFADELYKNFFPSSEEDEKKARELGILKEKKQESPYSLSNVCWFMAAIAVFYYLEFPTACLYDPRVQRTWFNIGALLIGVNLSIALFLVVWMSVIKKVPSDEWEVHYPAAIPIATASFIIGSFCVMVGLWPIWGWFTPFILFTLFMGLIVFITMIPNF